MNGHPRPRHAAWTLLAIPALLQVVLHLATNGSYGIFRDEYYYLACADRLAWGYVDQPPFSIWVLASWKTIFGVSVHSIRILPALCGAGLVFLTGMTAARLGGGRWAQLVAGIGSGIGAAGLVICGFYSMNCFDFLVWIAAYLLVIRIAEDGDGRWWLWLGLVLGLGLFNKIGVLVLGLAIAIGLVLTRLRRQLLDPRIWIAAGSALLFLVPYVVWNAANAWPTLEFMENATRYKIAAVSPGGFLAENVLEANPLTVPLWLGGLLWLLLARRARRYRIVGVMFVATWVILVAQTSKPYYFAASMPVMMAAGGAAWEHWTTRRGLRWVRWAMAVLLAMGFFLFLPLGVPIVSPGDLDRYQQWLGIVPNTGEVGHDANLPQYFADRFGWRELATTVSDVFHELPEDEWARTIVVGDNYGHSGALQYWSNRYDLPPVYGRHNNYWLWGPPTVDAETVVIAINFDVEGLNTYFSEVTVAGVSEAPWALEDRIEIAVCRGLQRPIAQVWSEIKLFI